MTEIQSKKLKKKYLSQKLSSMSQSVNTPMADLANEIPEEMKRGRIPLASDPYAGLSFSDLSVSELLRDTGGFNVITGVEMNYFGASSEE